MCVCVCVCVCVRARARAHVCVCLIVCDLETSTTKLSRSDLGCCATREKLVCCLCTTCTVFSTRFQVRNYLKPRNKDIVEKLTVVPLFRKS